jgi:Zn-dependent peptidase ImmA (M78 family)
VFGDTPRPTVVCRSSQAKERVEFQADLYASCLLMPRKRVMQAWRERFGNDFPRVVGRNTPCDAVERFAAAISAFSQDEALEYFARPFAEQFLVSPIAMRIRLERLGLLLREIPRQRSLMVER